MTMKEFAQMLSGREYGMEITKDEERQAADAGLVVAYGYSDDNVELRGAIDAEVGAYDGTTLYVNKDGLMYEPPCGGAGCRYYDKAREACETIDAVWCGGDAPWTFETDIPHETFTIYEDGEPFCIGIVFSMEDVKL